MMYKSKTKAAKNVMTQEAPFALECFPTRVSCKAVLIPIFLGLIS